MAPGPVMSLGALSGHGSAPGVTPGSLEQGPIDQGFSEIEDFLFPPAACCMDLDPSGGRRMADDAELEVEDRSGAVAPLRLRPPPRQGFVPPEDDIHVRIKRLRGQAAPPGAPMAGSGSESE